MKILLVHNQYKQKGGEDVVFEAEKGLLERYGHEVIEYVEHNDRIDAMGKLSMAVNTIWSRQSKRAIADVLAKEKPDVAHFHNTFMVISPSAYYACRSAGVPVVQTLHNYRLLCPNAIFFRDNQVCEDCLGKIFPFPGVRHGCYRDDKAASGVVATMLATHRLIGTWNRVIDRYIMLTDFAREKFISAGFPAEKLVVKPNFLKDDPGCGESPGDYMVFFGRLTHEKGVMTMLKAWTQVDSAIPLKIIGDGDLMDEMKQFVAEHNLTNVEIMGRRPREETINIVKDAAAFVFASEWYEGLPMTIIEAYATGTPVIASKLGAAATVVVDGETGLHFKAGDPGDLAAKVTQFWAERTPKMGQTARHYYETRYTAETNYDLLMNIYQSVQQERNAKPI